MTNDYSSFGAMYGVSTPVTGTFCTQPNGQQGVINDRGQCVAQAPLFAPSTMHLFNINNVPNPNINLNASDYGHSAVDYITNVSGVDNSGGVMPNGSYSGWDQAAIMDKAKQEVERAYQLYLGRDSDSGGLSYYSQKVMEAAMHKNPAAIKAIMEEIKNSPEGQAYAASQAGPSTTGEDSGQDSTGVETSTNSTSDTTHYCDGNNLVLIYSNGTVDGIENYAYCLNGEEQDLPVDHNNPEGASNNDLPAGTLLGKQCSGTTMTMFYSDGQGGSTSESVPESAECGYEPPYTGVDLGPSTYSSPASAGVGTITGYNYNENIERQRSANSQKSEDKTDHVKMLRGWLTNSLFKDII